MQLAEKKVEVVNTTVRFRENGKTIGLVPTMGYLHRGHLALIRQASRQNDVVAVSIFVNPTQFNEAKDFDSYPRDRKHDLEVLKNAKVQLLFMPSTEEMYPDDEKTMFDLGGLDRNMEGASRPGHFNGVAQIVTRLFDVFNPHRAYFGEKDFQQLVIIRHIVKTLGYPVEIVGCPIVREADGLAMSSRNKLLDAGQRAGAAVIPETLRKAVDMATRKSPAEVRSFVEETFADHPEAKLEYFEIADPITLEPLGILSQDSRAIAFIAVRYGPVRLIDNMRIL